MRMGIFLPNTLVSYFKNLMLKPRILSRCQGAMERYLEDFQESFTRYLYQVINSAKVRWSLQSIENKRWKITYLNNILWDYMRSYIIMGILRTHFIDWIAMRFRPSIILLLVLALEDNRT